LLAGHRRKTQTTRAYSDLQTKWRDEGIKVYIKLQLRIACAFLIPLYASETWTIKKEDI